MEELVYDIFDTLGANRDSRALDLCCCRKRCTVLEIVTSKQQPQRQPQPQQQQQAK